VHDASFGLRDDLGADDEDVAVMQPGRRDRATDQLAEIHARLDLGNALDGEDGEVLRLG
jgi:hypothetical protein